MTENNNQDCPMCPKAVQCNVMLRCFAKSIGSRMSYRRCRRAIRCGSLESEGSLMGRRMLVEVMDIEM
jgi:hypothetical protein